MAAGWQLNAAAPPVQSTGSETSKCEPHLRFFTQGGAGSGGAGDLAQYWEYCHLVPAKGLRTAYDSLLDGRCAPLPHML